VQEGDFQTHVLRLDGAVDLSPDVVLVTEVQFDTVSDPIGPFGREGDRRTGERSIGCGPPQPTRSASGCPRCNHP